MTGRLLTFRVGHGRYAVPLEDVLGVQDLAAADGGRVFFQGHPVTTVDARVLWSTGSSALATTKTPASIILGGGGEAALVVDRVEGIVEGVEMRPLPALVAAFVRNAFRGVTLQADGGRLVVDAAALSGTASGGGRGGPGEA